MSQNSRKRDHSHGIFNLKSSNNRNESDYDINLDPDWVTFDWCISLSKSPKSSIWSGCSNISGNRADFPFQLTLHTIYNELFVKVLRDTGKLVLAIEAVQTLLYSTAYYQNMFDFDMEAQVNIKPFALTLLPKRWWGLIIVGSLSHFTSYSSSRLHGYMSTVNLSTVYRVQTRSTKPWKEAKNIPGIVLIRWSRYGQNTNRCCCLIIL